MNARYRPSGETADVTLARSPERGSTFEVAPAPQSEASSKDNAAMNLVSRWLGSCGSVSETYRLHVVPAGGASASGLRGHAPGLAPGASTPLAMKYTLEPSSLAPGIRFSTSALPAVSIRRQVDQPPAQRFAGPARDFELVQVLRGFFADRFLA